MTTRPSDRATTLTTPEALAVLDEWAGSCAECDGEGIRAIPASLCSIPGDFEDCDGCADIRQARAHFASRIAELEAEASAARVEALKMASKYEAELAAVRANAERYVWLRDANNADPTPFIAQRYEYGIMQWTGEKADAAVDAARGAG